MLRFYFMEFFYCIVLIISVYKDTARRTKPYTIVDMRTLFWGHIWIVTTSTGTGGSGTNMSSNTNHSDGILPFITRPNC